MGVSILSRVLQPARDVTVVVLAQADKKTEAADWIQALQEAEDGARVLGGGGGATKKAQKEAQLRENMAKQVRVVCASVCLCLCIVLFLCSVS